LLATVTRRRAALVTVLGALAVPLGAGAAQAAAASKPVWLCHPGQSSDPCTPSLSTTSVTPAGEVGGPITVKKDARPAVDCFYVYPTVSDQKTIAATRRIDPEERSIALYQAARYSQHCRVYAPMYRQITILGLSKPEAVTPAIADRAYRDVRDAWRAYLRDDNHGRGVVLIGHSQGSYVLRRLVTEEIDPKPARRRQLVSALLLGGNVLVKKGRDVGGDFQHVRACHATAQLGCVVAFSSFNATPPTPARFGRPAGARGVDPAKIKGLAVLCTNPAALGGGRGKVTPIFPSAAFAPGTVIGAATELTGFPRPAVPTTFEQADDAYTAHCSSAGDAHVLRLEGAQGLKAVPDASWGLHLTDANIAQGNLVALVATQAKRYAARR
jgi:Protein of unknown function (DUF3089)